MRLIDLSAENMLDELERRQEATIEAEVREARAKVVLTATEGALLDSMKRQGTAVEIAKKLVWQREELLEAHAIYLDVWADLQRAKSAQVRAREAIELYRTARADARRA